jgi:hypothetical protein
MKLITITLLLLTLTASTISSQTNEECLKTSLKKSKIKESESCITQLCDVVLSTSLDADLKDQLLANQAQAKILDWADKTEFLFVLGEKMMDLCESDNRLLGIYISALAKAAIEVQSNDFQEKAIGHFVAFIKNETHDVKLTKRLKKLIVNFDAGEIERYIEKE